ncbi:Alpha/beta hydrolase fold-1 [Macrophomina phaseolina MS6]|uniref:Alpha/beta hydrolase fold-1 n=1 Tax=Macrophomina phaseolina (strain MS6) TaxID=1126212 RepID=K2SD17_MACPH|nr:Alpha/beta hydrolase fold-1 [Macrophomina phaseolina MS6]
MALSETGVAQNAEDLPPLPLPSGVTARQVPGNPAGLSFHILEAGFDPTRTKPLILLLHGYPELAFSWRKVMRPLSSAGFYVVAVDQRGYGRTTGWDTSPYSTVDLSQFTMTRLVGDMLVLVSALGYEEVRCVVGHDFGAVSASFCALMRPDVFKSVIMMSHPFKPPPALPFNSANLPPSEQQQADMIVGRDIQDGLASLDPPRMHYKWYNSTAQAAQDWGNPPQGLKMFLRGYFHLKSADWDINKPHPLQDWSASELAKMPEYYIMPLSASMPDVVASNMANEDVRATEKWLSDEDIGVYVGEWERNGFQGALNWYRCQTDPKQTRDLHLFAGKKIDVPSKFITGIADWGNYQVPGALESYPQSCSDFRGVSFVDNAGHWPQQEQPQLVVEKILRFVTSL